MHTADEEKEEVGVFMFSFLEVELETGWEAIEIGKIMFLTQKYRKIVKVFFILDLHPALIKVLN